MGGARGLGKKRVQFALALVDHGESFGDGKVVIHRVDEARGKFALAHLAQGFARALLADCVECAREGALEAREHGLGFREGGLVELHVGAVVGANDREAHGCCRVLGENVFSRDEVAEALAHFHPVDCEHPRMHPALRKAVASSVALRLLVFMVRKAKIKAATVNVEALPHVFFRHRRALKVPAGPPFAKRG